MKIKAVLLFNPNIDNNPLIFYDAIILSYASNADGILKTLISLEEIDNDADHQN